VKLDKIVNLCTLHLKFSWLSKSQTDWYTKTYTHEKWMEVIKRSRKIQLIRKHNPQLSDQEIFLGINRMMTLKGVKPTHMVPIFILAGEPWSELYFKSLGQEGYLPKDEWRYRKDFYSGHRLNYTEMSTDWDNEIKSLG